MSFSDFQYVVSSCLTIDLLVVLAMLLVPFARAFNISGANQAVTLDMQKIFCRV